MKKFVALTILTLSYFISSANETSHIDFFEGSFEAAMEKAGEEGKLFLVDFYASWCAPCKWMDKTTFTNKDLASYANENYISLKVNIDDLDGFSWKQKYDVQYLPTILIFNSKGVLIDRIEETMSASKLLRIIKNHNSEDNNAVIKHRINNSPREALKELKKYQAEQTRVPQYEYYLKKTQKTNFKLLIGTYAKYEDALEKYHILKSRFIEPIIVLNDIEGSNMVYKILMGDFLTETEAEDYKNILESKFSIESTVY
jgi:thiol-disulfide isomerase/thioredoxin